MKLRNIEQIQKIILHKDSTIRDVIKNLNESQLKISLVMKEKKQLLGIIVDGDVRRGLLKGYSLEEKIEKIVQKNPITTSPKQKKNEVMMLMKENNLQHVPVINDSGQLVGLHMFEDADLKIQRDNKIIIMAGGLGKRLLPITKKIPKAMIKISGLPMLEHVVLLAKKNGFKNFIFSINYLGYQIKEYFSSGKKIDVSISYIEEKKALGTAGSLCYLKNLNKEAILVTNCDIVSGVDYGDVLDYHNHNSADATMVVRRYETRNPFGVIETKDNNFISYKEKPVKNENINAGIYVLESNVLKYIENENYLDMPDFFMKLKKEGKKVIVYPIYESWLDLGQPKNSVEK